MPLFVTVTVTGAAAMLTTEDRVRLLLLRATDGAVVAGPDKATLIGLLVGAGSGPGPVPDKVMTALAVRVLLLSASAGVKEYVIVQVPLLPATERPGAQDSLVTLKSLALVPLVLTV